jgi:hypothetical protein
MECDTGEGRESWNMMSDEGLNAECDRRNGRESRSMMSDEG